MSYTIRIKTQISFHNKNKYLSKCAAQLLTYKSASYIVNYIEYILLLTVMKVLIVITLAAILLAELASEVRPALVRGWSIDEQRSRKSNTSSRLLRQSAELPALPAESTSQQGHHNYDDQCDDDSSSSDWSSGAADSSQNVEPEEECYSECSDESLQLLLRGNADFTGKCLYEAHQLYPNKSLIMSPFSLLNLFGQLAYSSKNETYTQLMKVLNLRDKNDIRCAFPALAERLNAEQNVKLNIAARIFATDVHPLSKNFIDYSKNIFDAEAESVDFTKSAEAANRINEWVASKTNNRIKNLVAPDAFNSLTRLVLANAIYFLGNWINQFDPKKTSNRDFYVDRDTVIQIPTMSQGGNFNYAEVNSLDCKVLEVFYKGGNFSFVIFVPNDYVGVTELINKLQDSDTLFSAYNSTKNVKVQVYLPKMKIESEYELKDILEKANIKDLFDPNLAKLDGILEKFEQLYVSAAKQKAFVEVDEKGTEATAANFVQLDTRTKPATFEADRPFVFYIFHRKTPIFCGKFQPTP